MEIKKLNLNPRILKALEELGFTEAMPIQEKCIPEILKGKDIFGQSSTGSGKTAAFGAPILERIKPGSGLQVLILTPTRELCVQDADSMRSFAKYLHIKINSVYGGVSIGPQIGAIAKSEVVVGTPGRILDHIQRGTIFLDKVKFLVLDEGDKMFEMGFIEPIEEIISHVSKERQTLLFSATIPKGVYDLAKRHLRNPVTIKSQTYVDKNLMKQTYYDIKAYDKFSLLVHLLKNKTHGLALVFCATRREVDSVSRNLIMQGVKAMAIHGGLTQNRRLHALDSLKKEHIDVLVATDVAARGLDIKNVSHVYNYDVPKSSDEYVHRIGRTARAGMSGDAVTLLSERDHENFNRVLTNRTLEIHKAAAPVFERVEFERHRESGRRHGFGASHRGAGRYSQRADRHGGAHGRWQGRGSGAHQESSQGARQHAGRRRPFHSSSHYTKK